MEKVFNKLVRDNIPEIVTNNGEEAVTRVLDQEEYLEELLKKLFEEAQEVKDSKTSDETLEEVADVLEILKAIAELYGKKLDDVIEIARQKRLKRGGLEKRIFLEKTFKKEDIK